MHVFILNLPAKVTHTISLLHKTSSMNHRYKPTKSTKPRENVIIRMFFIFYNHLEESISASQCFCFGK